VDETKNAEGADVIAVTAPVMPNAADYTERKDYNRARKTYDDAVWASTHPKAAKAGPDKVWGLVDMPDAVKSLDIAGQVKYAAMALKYARGQVVKWETILSLLDVINKAV
jgi:hypothetical protein